MKEKDLLIQLKKLKGVRPDREWKKTNRELLYSQISAQADDNVKIGWFKSLERQLSIAFLRVSQPAMTVLLIIIFIFGGSVLSLRAARNTTPGDSMYIAKILSEKTQYALTFNEKSKAKLGLEFAGNRVKEINKVLAQTETVDTNKAETVEKLKVLVKKQSFSIRIVTVPQNSKTWLNLLAQNFKFIDIKMMVLQLLDVGRAIRINLSQLGASNSETNEWMEKLIEDGEAEIEGEEAVIKAVPFEPPSKDEELKVRELFNEQA